MLRHLKFSRFSRIRFYDIIFRENLRENKITSCIPNPSEGSEMEIYIAGPFFRHVRWVELQNSLISSRNKCVDKYSNILRLNQSHL